MKRNVTKEPKDFWSTPPEDCSECHKPTRYWLEDGHTPLCQECANKDIEPKKAYLLYFLEPIAFKNTEMKLKGVSLTKDNAIKWINENPQISSHYEEIEII